jgi:hypothetical protein
VDASVSGLGYINQRRAPPIAITCHTACRARARPAGSGQGPMLGVTHPVFHPEP